MPVSKNGKISAGGGKGFPKVAKKRRKGREKKKERRSGSNSKNQANRETTEKKALHIGIKMKTHDFP